MILTPFRYCEYRQAEGPCVRLATSLLKGMPFCTYHFERLETAIAENETEFLPAAFAVDPVDLRPVDVTEEP